MVGSLAASVTCVKAGGACICGAGTFMTAGTAERIGNCTQLSLGLSAGLSGGATNALATGWGVGVPMKVLVVAGGLALAAALSYGAGAGVRGRGGNRIQLSISVTGPWAKLGKDRPAEIAKASVALAP